MSETLALTDQSDRMLLDREGKCKYLTFALAREEYGLEILKVREIIGYVDIDKVLAGDDFGSLTVANSSAPTEGL